MTDADMNTFADPTCGTCDDHGWEIYLDAQGTRRARECTKCDYWESRRGFAPGVPEDEHPSRLANFTKAAATEDAIRQAQFFLDGVHPDLYLWGPVGTGKTRLACSILNELHQRRRGQVRFWRVAELLNKLLPGAEDTDQRFDQVASVPFLVLDDLGVNQGTDWARRQLLTIYDGRRDRGHRTIFTSNLSLNELGQQLNDDRLPSRIAGNAKTVEMAGPDWRLKQAKQRLKGK